ncbi:hypothetical protein FO519_007971 [Halicephalobus sp. NKZ332]|nr:hypothetical protein FO519_007971 [Halicephalobus sp. NKZ332]
MSIVKKFINSAPNSVPDSLKGLVMSDPGVIFSQKNFRVVLRSDLDDIKEGSVVTLISGGGSGHEPFAAGFVGFGGLSAAVSGDVFASPSSEAVFHGLQEIYSPSGTIVFVINYTGDRLNFGTAVERFKAETKNDNVDLVYIDDDVALEDKTGITVGGRGLAGAVLLFQIAGYLSEVKLTPFQNLLEISREIVKNTATFGVSLEPCAIPGKSRMFVLNESEMELGLGIHGEPGCQRSQMQSAGEIVDEILGKLTSSSRLNLNAWDRIVVFLNNLGSTSQIEMNILSGEILQWLSTNGFHNIVRFISGTGMTSIDGHGFSITILRILDDQWEKAFDHPSSISRRLTFLNPKITQFFPTFSIPVTLSDERTVPSQGAQVYPETASRFRTSVKSAAFALKSKEQYLNELDECGDGDCGSTLKTASEAILNHIDEGKIDFRHPQTALLQLAHVFEEFVGGTTGAIYAMLLTSGSSIFEHEAHGDNLHSALKKGLEAVMKYGHAEPGHRTMVDPLDAAIKASESWNTKDDWQRAVKAAEEAAESTMTMEAKSGRASYTSVDQQKKPDPGAVAVAIWMRAIFDAFYG